MSCSSDCDDSDALNGQGYVFSSAFAAAALFFLEFSLFHYFTRSDCHCTTGWSGSGYRDHGGIHSSHHRSVFAVTITTTTTITITTTTTIIITTTITITITATITTTSHSRRLHLPVDNITWDVIRAVSLSRLGLENKVIRRAAPATACDAI